jgi:hypothetical protein
MTKAIALSLLALGALGFAANAEPVKLSKAHLDKVVAGSGCCEQINGGGNTPNGTANGVPNVNNGGNAPPGQQPKR